MRKNEKVWSLNLWNDEKTSHNHDVIAWIFISPEREERKKRKRDGDEDYVPAEFGDYGSSLSERVKQRKRGPMQGSDIGEDTNSCDVEGKFLQPSVLMAETLWSELNAS